MTTSKCTMCGKPTERRPQNKFHPFCSERCRLLDLGKWLNEGYRVPGPRVGDGSEEGAEEARPGGAPAPHEGDGEPDR